MYYIKIKKAEMVPDKFGEHIKITMIGLRHTDEETGEDKHIKWIKLTPMVIQALCTKTFEITDDQAKKLME